ncbi:type-F conjugative transfer system protein TraW [Piscinibacter sakaiensis]|uniref:type-F conjugative transfer system protein TraW n=1 Tax=Piscinibacter sakaiensis TaxID=1547922 RepID=UPI003AB08331
MIRSLLRSILGCAVTLGCPSISAVDIGALGPTYTITEPHLLRFIEQRLREKQRTGELQRLMEQAQQRGVRTITAPTPVVGLRPTSTARSFFIDPSFTLDRNITDASGRLLFAAGTRKNPLEVVSLTRQLLFFDARDRKQVARARELMTARPGGVKPILTGGSYLDLMKAWRVPVYFDQQGVLVQRFGIQQVPALVSQDGTRLRVDELRLP